VFQSTGAGMPAMAQMRAAGRGRRRPPAGAGTVPGDRL